MPSFIDQSKSNEHTISVCWDTPLPSFISHLVMFKWETYPPVCVFRTFIVVPESESRHLHNLWQIDDECVILTLCERDQPHVVITCCDVHPIYQPATYTINFIKYSSKYSIHNIYTINFIKYSSNFLSTISTQLTLSSTLQNIQSTKYT